jgi:hypothetical protein
MVGPEWYRAGTSFNGAKIIQVEKQLEYVFLKKRLIFKFKA